MKILIQKKQLRTVTLRISEEVMRKVDSLAKQNKLSRQMLVETIIETAINSKDFEIKVSKNDIK